MRVWRSSEDLVLAVRVRTSLKKTGDITSGIAEHASLSHRNFTDVQKRWNDVVSKRYNGQEQSSKVETEEKSDHITINQVIQFLQNNKQFFKDTVLQEDQSYEKLKAEKDELQEKYDLLLESFEQLKRILS